MPDLTEQTATGQDRWPEPWATVLGDPQVRAALERVEVHLQSAEAQGATIYPPKGLRLRALRILAPEAIKVVILGQDPYHGSGQAEGPVVQCAGGATYSAIITQYL